MFREKATWALIALLAVYVVFAASIALGVFQHAPSPVTTVTLDRKLFPCTEWWHNPAIRTLPGESNLDCGQYTRRELVK